MLDDQPVCSAVLVDRYAAPGETSPQQVFQRVAHALAACECDTAREDVARRFCENMVGGAIGAGRIMANAGRARDATMINCFVHPIGEGGHDAAPVTPRQLDQAIADARVTLRMGGGVGYDFSAVAPRDALVDPGDIAGACDAIDRFDASCAALHFTGPRRGAQMAVLRCDHPDVFEFVRAKRGRKRWHTFNVSVAVTDAFMHAVERGARWPLVHRAPASAAARAAGASQLANGHWFYLSVPARRLWHALVQNARDSSEPGVLFIDTINEANNLRGLEMIDATNPCAEQPLPAHGSCVLGPVDLTRLVHYPFGHGGTPYFDYEQLAARVRTQVRLLDNVLELTRWPLAVHAREAAEKRRIGVGVTGLADALTMLRLPYGSAAACESAARIARCMRDHAYAASADLAAERGPFPCFDASRYLEPGRFGFGLPEPVRDTIAAHGLRNSHLLSFAPVGSVSVAFFDNCSNGVEPAYRWAYRRAVRVGDAPPRWVPIENHAYRLWRRLNGTAPLPDYFVHAAQVSADAQVAMLAALQPYVDAAISKTVIVTPDASHRQIDTLLFAAWRARLKGMTVFRPDPALDAVLDAGGDESDVPDIAGAHDPRACRIACGI